MRQSDRSRAISVGGYVLAGGRSSRMGRDKALLQLAGRPLVAHAAAKLRRVAGEANILSGTAPGNPALRAFGLPVFDDHPDCGPLGGIDAALRHSTHEWNLILPVDVPFLPAAFLEWWVRDVTTTRLGRCFVSMFRAGGRPQPAVLMLHRAVAPYVGAALERGGYKLLPVMEEAARQLAPPDSKPADAVPHLVEAADWLKLAGMGARAGPVMTEPQARAFPLWFANLNTPEDFLEAELHIDALDSSD